jgi:hypothetical protein
LLESYPKQCCERIENEIMVNGIIGKWKNAKVKVCSLKFLKIFDKIM